MQMSMKTVWMIHHARESSISDTSSKMLEKVSADDVSLYQSYTLRRIDEKQTTMHDTEHYKLNNVNENAMSNKFRYLDVLCFPTFFPSGKFGEIHSHKT